MSLTAQSFNYMKKRIIRIIDVSQIDTSKVSVYDLNNRYIDPLGNIYGLRYNKDNRKVDVIKLERFHSGEGHIYQQIANRHREGKFPAETTTEPDNFSNDLETKAGIEDLLIEPEVFIEDVINNAETHKERITAIIKNIYDSDIFPKENKQESTEFDDIVRNLEIEGIQQLAKLETYYRELTNYTRSITYYQAKIDNTGKRIFEQLAGNKERTMRFIFMYEMATTIKRIYTNLKKHILRMDDFTSIKNVDERQNMTKHQKQSFIDARTSIGNTINDIDDILKQNAVLIAYSCNISNYQ
jgi:hypothetical protein